MLDINEERFRLALARARIGVWDWDLTINRVNYSDEWKRIRGYEDDGTQDSIDAGLQLVHPDDVHSLRAGRAKLVDGELNDLESEHRVRHASGSWVWILERSHAIREDDGTTVRVVGCDLEITSRKEQELARQRGVRENASPLSQSSATNKTEEKLQIVSDRLNFILKSASVGIWEWLPTTDELIWDEGMMKIYGVEPSQFTGKSDDWKKRVHLDDIERLMTVEQPRLFETGHISTEFRIIRDNGDTRHIYADQFIRRDATGEIVTGLNIDVTDRKMTEQALEDSENKFLRIAEHFPGMVYRFVAHSDGSHEFAYVSSQVREIFELEPEAAIGDATNMWNRTHPDDREWLRQEIIASADVLEPFLCEYRLNLPEKGIRWVQSFAQPVRTDAGDVIWDGIVIDQTDRKSADLALQESQAQFHRMTEKIPGMIFKYVLHPDSSHAVLYANSRTKDLFGFSAEAAMEDVERCMNRIHPNDLPGYQHAMMVSAETLEEFKQECRIVLDDRVIWVETTSIPERLDNGDIVWDGVTIDITQRKETELALHESQSQFQRMTENVPGMICQYRLAPDGTEALSYVSSKCRELFGVEPEEVIQDANQLFASIHPDDVDSFYETFRKSAQTLQPINEEFRVILPEQGLQWRRAIGQPTAMDGGTTVFDGVVLDITDAKQSELQLRHANDELAAATKIKDQFLANMSHEFRTPLNAILGMVEGLQNGLYGTVNAKQRTGLDVVRQSGKHLLDLINDILDLARIESGQIQLNRAYVDVKSLCESSLQLVTPQAEKKKIRLSLNVPWNLPKLFADEQRIRQVLINLLINSVKFTPDGGAIALMVEHVSSSRCQVEDVLRISVIDSGIGIDPNLLDSVFLPFVQVDSSLSRTHDGTGLGLSLVKQFIDLHGGTVTVTSQPNAGSCFAIELPFHQSQHTDKASAEERIESDSRPSQLSLTESLDAANSFNPIDPSPASPTILLAEDNDSVAMSVTWYLEARGYQVHRAIDGEIAISLAKTCNPDFILMDIQMPNLDGLSAIQQLRAMPEIKDTPIVALTGLATEDDYQRCLAAGANDYLSKPYPMEQLIEKIAALLSNDSTAPN